MRAMGKAELKQELTKRADARKAAEKELGRLAKERDEYLKKQASDGEGGFDTKVNAAIDEQLKR
jgi:flagellar biosynthesis chaperone FliJ